MTHSSTVQAPQPSAAETQLQQEQVNALRQQQAAMQDQLHQQNLLAPVLYKQAGIIPQYDSSGHITGYTEAPKTQQQQMMEKLQTTAEQQALADYTDPRNKEISSMLRQRTLDALKGNLPVDPGLERNLTETKATLDETLRKQLGPGYETSTAGQQALADFSARANELRYGARTGQLTLGEQLQGAEAGRQATIQQGLNANTSLAAGLQNQRFGQVIGAGSFTSPTIAALGGNAAGYSQPLSWYSNNRNLQFQANAANAQSSDANNAAWGQLAGTALTVGAVVF